MFSWCWAYDITPNWALNNFSILHNVLHCRLLLEQANFLPHTRTLTHAHAHSRTHTHSSPHRPQNTINVFQASNFGDHSAGVYLEKSKNSLFFRWHFGFSPAKIVPFCVSLYRSWRSMVRTLRTSPSLRLLTSLGTTHTSPWPSKPTYLVSKENLNPP